MAISLTDFIVSLSPSPIGVVLGMNGNMTLSFSNINPTDTGYNLSVQITLPNGVSFGSSSVAPTSVVDGPSDTIIISWTNIKDLAPNELGYTIDLNLISDETFRTSGLPVPFDVPLVDIAMSASLDTLPRGDDDPGNVVITKTANSNFIPLRYNLAKSAPEKMPKGAGSLVPPTNADWPYQYTLTIENNTRSSSNVTLIDNLPNGVRYLGNLVVIGPDAGALSAPTVILPSGSQDFTTLDWGAVTLSTGSVNTITFDAAIWNNYTVGGVENSGSPILHGTPLTNHVELNGDSGIVTADATTTSLDATIDKSVTPTMADVGSILNYTLTYRINQYDPIDAFIITDLISDGQTYNSDASVPPSSVTVNLDGTTEIVWNLGNLATSTSGTITFTTTVDAAFSGGAPVSSSDALTNNAQSDGTNATLLTPVPDSSSSNTLIDNPTITKVLNGYFYKDGTPKLINVASPGDLVEFTITFNSTGIVADQLNVQIDEYAPLNMGPLTPALPVIYGGTIPGVFIPVTVTPNGLRWTLGDLSGNNTWTATFRVPVQNTVFVGSANNLAKLAFTNTEGQAFSGQDQVAVDFGEPEIQFEKTVSPLTNPVSPGETYTYSLTVSNPQNVEGTVTDAFNMLLTDVIPTGMTYTGVFSVVGTGSYTAPVFAGQNVSMTITQLAPDQSLTLNYEVIVDAGVAPGAVLTNNAILQRPYSQPDNSFQYPGDPFTASVTKDVAGLTIDKTANITTAKVGEDITYTLTFTVPDGTIAYTPRVTDILPAGQTYIGPATRQVLPGPAAPVIPTVVGQTITFPDNPDIDASAGAVTVIYTFVARITSADHVPPFTEIQTNSSSLQWAVEPGGPLTETADTTLDITATTPNLVILKEQRNFTQGGAYTTSDINVAAGDVIYYRLSITSNGASPAYAISLDDILSDMVSYGAIISGPSVGSVTPPGPPPGATLTWDIPQLNNGDPAATLEFSVTFTNTPGSGEKILNLATAEYDSNTVNPVQYSTNSNEVTAIAPSLRLNKTASKLSLHVGETLTYVLTLTIPADVTAYNVIISDTLPVGQTFAGNAKRNYASVTPSVFGQTVTFATESVLGPYAVDTTITYSFNSTVTSAAPPYPQIQANHSEVTWDTTPIGPAADTVTSDLDIEVLEALPYRGISIEDTLNNDFEETKSWNTDH